MSLANLCERSFAGAILATLLSLGWIQAANAQDPLARAAASSANLAAARGAFEALSASEREGLQDALIWTGLYNGIADGAFGRATFDAISAYQQSRRKAPSGVLTPADRAELLSIAQRARDAAGFTIVDDARTGVRIGIPRASLPKSDTNPGGGTRWQSADDKVTLDTRTAPPDATLQSLYDRNLAIQAAGRVITYKILRPNFLVIAGETSSGKFYTRYDSGASGIRGFSIGYDRALAPQLDRLAVAIANSFDPFPSKPATSTSPPPANAKPATLAAPRSDRQVIGTGIVVASRRVLTAARLASCRNLHVGGISAPTPQQPAAWSVIELAQDLPGATVPLVTAMAKGGEAVLVLSYASDLSLTVVPGTMADAALLIAPLQPGAGGAPVIDEANRLIGLVAPADRDGRKIAGIMTTARYGIVPAAAFSASLPAGGQSPPAESPRGAAAIASSWKPALVSLTCEE